MIIDIIKDPQENTYRNLINYALNFCDSFILIVRKDLPKSDNLLSINKKLNPFLKSLKEDSVWPGTRLLKGSAYIFEYLFILESAKLLKSSANSLFEWMQPRLPEDLCFLRDQRSWLTTISHEHDAYFDITENEFATLLQNIPGLEIKFKE